MTGRCQLASGIAMATDLEPTPACQQSDCYDLPHQARDSHLTPPSGALLSHLAPCPQVCQAGKAVGRIWIEVIDFQLCESAVDSPEEEPGLGAICVLGNCIGDPLRRSIGLKGDATASAPATANDAKPADASNAIRVAVAYHSMLQEPADH